MLPAQVRSEVLRHTALFLATYAGDTYRMQAEYRSAVEAALEVAGVEPLDFVDTTICSLVVSATSAYLDGLRAAALGPLAGAAQNVAPWASRDLEFTRRYAQRFHDTGARVLDLLTELRLGALYMAAGHVADALEAATRVYSPEGTTEHLSDVVLQYLEGEWALIAHHRPSFDDAEWWDYFEVEECAFWAAALEPGIPVDPEVAGAAASAAAEDVSPPDWTWSGDSLPTGYLAAFRRHLEP